MMKRPNRLMFISFFAAVLLGAGPGLSAEPKAADQDKDPAEKILQARARLQEGWDSWNREAMQSGRDMFLNLIVRQPGRNPDLYYYAGLSEYRLTVHAFSSGRADEAAAGIGQAKKYLEKLMEMEPGRGEPFALYATLLGYEIALNPGLAMELGMRSQNYFGQAERKEPGNPRVRLLKGLSLMYQPAEYAGGTARALQTLQDAVALFEKEKPADPIKPTWGLDEALTFMARIYRKKGEIDKAIDCLKRALAANPAFLLAGVELKELVREN